MRFIHPTVVLPSLLVAMLLATGCATIPSDTTPAQLPAATAAHDTHEQLHAVLWVQTAGEFRALALQAFNVAERMMNQALADPTWTAATEQTGSFAVLPPAVIVDADETVLDNSAYQARLIETAQSYSSATFTSWVNEERATAIPGAVEFARAAQRNGVTVFYVTNRKAVEEEPTRRNLVKLGFPVPEGIDVLLVRGERPEWDTSDKTARRSFVASRYRVLLQVGDNLGDFMADVKVPVDDRFAAADRFRSFWGTRWIVIPNPAYGNWESAVLDHSFERSDAEILRIKRNRLNAARDPVD